MKFALVLSLIRFNTSRFAPLCFNLIQSYGDYLFKQIDKLKYKIIKQYLRMISKTPLKHVGIMSFLSIDMKIKISSSKINESKTPSYAKMTDTLSKKKNPNVLKQTSLNKNKIYLVAFPSSSTPSATGTFSNAA